MRSVQTPGQLSSGRAGNSLPGESARAAADRRPSGPAPRTAWRDAAPLLKAKAARLRRFFSALDPRLRGDDEEGAGMTRKERG